MVDSYYDKLAPCYKYIYPDWERSAEYQAAALDEVIREYFGDQVSTVLEPAGLEPRASVWLNWDPG